MDSLFAVQGKDFVVVATDSTVGWSIFRLKEGEDKIINLDDNKIMAMSGEAPDRLQFADYIQKNIHLKKYLTDRKLTTKEAANYTRYVMAQNLRRSPYQINCVIAGLDNGEPNLYWIDYLGTLQKVTRGGHGYAGMFTGGLIDNFWRPDLTLEEALKIIQYCINELNQRFLLNQRTFIIKCIDKDGIRVIS